MNVYFFRCLSSRAFSIFDRMFNVHKIYVLGTHKSALTSCWFISLNRTETFQHMVYNFVCSVIIRIVFHYSYSKWIQVCRIECTTFSFRSLVHTYVFHFSEMKPKPLCWWNAICEYGNFSRKDTLLWALRVLRTRTFAIDLPLFFSHFYRRRQPRQCDVQMKITCVANFHSNKKEKLFRKSHLIVAESMLKE